MARRDSPDALAHLTEAEREQLFRYKFVYRLMDRGFSRAEASHIVMYRYLFLHGEWGMGEDE